ncbi:TetR family transcriptional regulator [Leifsonia xyli subsp. xyli]|uniref:Transcriptional regulator, TetR family n=2 Tax=Leifsonia xyli subsp. xyli TaxID=59736 RepID=Q6ADW9_LEIXX|nr:TetR/AcrR family transcriptional regulator [Leifsonia xyli]AAT89427.1 transcriptional regulator, TetR family [Leifsonia xyli subsp. xyli str. CTCB07]ODA90571.1 TetR family transcriptional regulator [Leifsonia xyli subsp. xyli]
MGRPRTFDDEAVLSRAMEEFWTHGYACTSPAQLAEATGIAKGSLYNAFSSKRALFDRCLDLYHRHVIETTQEWMGHPGTARECISAALKAVVDGDLAQPQRRGCLIGNTAVELAGEDAEMSFKLRRMKDESTAWFAERIRRGQVEGDVPRDRDAQALAEHVANTLAGLRVMAMTHEAPALHRIIDTALMAL